MWLQKYRKHERNVASKYDSLQWRSKALPILKHDDPQLKLIRQGEAAHHNTAKVELTNAVPILDLPAHEVGEQ